MKKTFFQVLIDRGVDPETARIVTIVVIRELKGCLPSGRTQIEQEAMDWAEAQLDKAILAYGLAEKLTPSTIKQVNKKAHSLGMLQVGATEFWDDF